MNFAEKIKQLRKEQNLSQADLAAALHISTKSVSNYETGTSYPRRRETYQKLADILHCDVNYLLTEDAEFVAGASDQYGSRGKKQAQEILEDAKGLFAGGEMSEEDMDEWMMALQEAFWIAKKNNRKCVPKKYRNDETEG